MTGAQLILASASPRRCQLLAQIGVEFHQQAADVDETPLAGESAEAYVLRVASAKARAVHRTRSVELPVLGADTEVVIDGKVLGKPRDAAHGRELLQRLSGRSHEVLSAVVVIDAEETFALSRSRVWFRTLDGPEIEAYWRSGEPCDKAGAYAIQGLGALFVERLEGSYSGVMGLPLYETGGLLQDIGIQVLG